MKRLCKKTLVGLSIAAMGLSTTSCATEILNQLDWGTLLTQIMTNVFNNGTTNVYRGDYSLQHLPKGQNGFVIGSEKLQFEGTGITVTQTRNNTINITLPGTDGIGNATMTDVTVYNLEFTKNEDSGVMTNYIDLGTNSSIDGKLTVDGKQYDASNLYIKAYLTGSQLVISEASIYFGSDESQAINVTFSGQIVQQQQ